MSHLWHASAVKTQSSPRLAARTSIALSCIKLLFVGLGSLPFARAYPLEGYMKSRVYSEEPSPADDPELWIYLVTAIFLVLMGGAFAGLTIALMGQDEIYLQVIATSSEGSERRNASRVLWLLRKGKHWVLVTLLLGNVITNETLPIVLDRSIGGGWPAVAASTALVVIFGEIAPQSICVRYGLPIGAMTAPFTLLLMWLLFPIAYPIAKLLDYLLGEDHGTTYKKAGLKQLVTLHKTLGTTPGERLNEDEVTIISAVLDLKDKPVGSIMTPMEDVFTLSADAILDENLMETIMCEGYSRIPIYSPTNHEDFVGMLLVKMLITYDPEDCKRVSDFSLATLPETRPETSCLDIINFFQQGKSHMVLVSASPGDTHGAMGVVTLEDVIEELIGEEIIDESDVFVDIHKAIRRMTPAPIHRTRLTRVEYTAETENGRVDMEGNLLQLDDEWNKDEQSHANGGSRRVSFDSLYHHRPSASTIGRSPTPNATFYVRRKSNGSGEVKAVHMRGYTPEIKEQLKNLGPSNAASKPKQSRVNTVKIKPGVSTILERPSTDRETDVKRTSESRNAVTTPLATAAQEGVGRDLVSPGLSAKDGVQAVATSYGLTPHRLGARGSGGDEGRDFKDSLRPSSAYRTHSHSTLGSMRSRDGVRRSSSRKRGTVRSGSITEQLVDVGGIKKLVLEMTSSSEDADGPEQSKANSRQHSRQVSRKPSHDSRLNEHDDHHNSHTAAHGKKKSKRKRGSKQKYRDHEHEQRDEHEPLLHAPDQ